MPNLAYKLWGLETDLVSRWEGVRQKFPGDFLRSFPDFPGSSRTLPRGQPLSLRSLTPAPDSQKLSLINDTLGKEQSR